MSDDGSRERLRDQPSGSNDGCCGKDACCGNENCKNFWTAPNILVIVMTLWAGITIGMSCFEFIGSRILFIDAWIWWIGASLVAYMAYFVTFEIMAHNKRGRVGSTANP